MTRWIKQALGGICVFLLIGFSAAWADIITVRADSWPPFNDDPASAQPGYAVEILKAIFEPLGHTIDYQVMPWTRAVAEVTAGKFDALIGATTADAPGCILPTETMGNIINSFFVLKGSTWTFQGVDSLKSIKLGCIDGYAYDEGAVDEYIKANTSPAVQNSTGDDALKKNIQKLQAARIDAIMECDQVMKFALVKEGVAEGTIVEAGKIGELSPLYFAFAPTKESSKKYAEQYSEGIKKLRESGELKKILDRYQQTDWK